MRIRYQIVSLKYLVKLFIEIMIGEIIRYFHSLVIEKSCVEHTICTDNLKIVLLKNRHHHRRSSERKENIVSQ